MPKTRSLWQGDCFVFDYRVAVDHDLQPAKWKIDPETGQPKPMSEGEIEKLLSGVVVALYLKSLTLSKAIGVPQILTGKLQKTFLQLDP